MATHLAKVTFLYLQAECLFHPRNCAHDGKETGKVNFKKTDSNHDGGLRRCYPTSWEFPYRTRRFWLFKISFPNNENRPLLADGFAFQQGKITSAWRYSKRNKNQRNFACKLSYGTYYTLHFIMQVGNYLTAQLMAFIFARVSGPTKPVDSIPFSHWKSLTAILVKLPKYPVGFTVRYPLAFRNCWSL